MPDQHLKLRMCKKELLMPFPPQPSPPWVFLFSVNGTTMNPVVQAKNLEAMLDFSLSHLHIWWLSKSCGLPLLSTCAKFIYFSRFSICPSLIWMTAIACFWSPCFHFYLPLIHSQSRAFKNGGQIMWLTGLKPSSGFPSLRVNSNSLRLLRHPWLSLWVDRLFCKGLVSTSLRLCETCDLCCNRSALLL